MNDEFKKWEWNRDENNFNECLAGCYNMLAVCVKLGYG
jgi:hypothetical protein